MKLYWVQKKDDGELEMTSGEVLEEGNALYMVESDNAVGAIQIDKADAWTTPAAAIMKYQDEIMAKLVFHEGEVEELGRDKMRVRGLVIEMMLEGIGKEA